MFYLLREKSNNDFCEINLYKIAVGIDDFSFLSPRFEYVFQETCERFILAAAGYPILRQVITFFL